MSTDPERRGALLWVAAGASIWGLDTLLRRPLTQQLASSQIVLLEHLILTVVLGPVLLRRRREWIKLRPVEWLAVLGIAWGGSALGSICFTEAVRLGNPTSAILLQKLQPLITALLAAAFLGEALGISFWGRLVVALGGAYLVSFGIHLPETRDIGMATSFALAAAALWGSSTVLGRFMLAKVSFFTLTGLRILVAVPLLAGLAWSPGLMPRLDARQALSLLLLALLPGLAALLIYYRGLGHTRASRAAVAELCFPATATVLNWIFLGVRISLAQIAGFALLWSAILSWEIKKSKAIRRTPVSEGGVKPIA